MQSREQSVICRGPSRRGRDQAGCVDEIAAVRHRGTGACVKEHRVRADRYLACAIYAYIFEEPTMSTVAGTSIYDAIGGEPALVAVVDDFYMRVTGDPELARVFRGNEHGHAQGTAGRAADRGAGQPGVHGQCTHQGRVAPDVPARAAAGRSDGRPRLPAAGGTASGTSGSVRDPTFA